MFDKIRNYKEKTRLCGFKVPQYFWFVLSGGLCDFIQAFIDYGISLIYIAEWERATICWTVSYILSIWVRHFSHRVLVFGEFEGSYLSSLARTYLTYSSSIVISIITNHYLVSLFQRTHQEAWIITMLWTGIYNYFMLKASWRNPPTEKSALASSNNAIISTNIIIDPITSLKDNV